jgi:hypothetical protein
VDRPVHVRSNNVATSLDNAVPSFQTTPDTGGVETVLVRAREPLRISEAVVHRFARDGPDVVHVDEW